VLSTPVSERRVKYIPCTWPLKPNDLEEEEEEEGAALLVGMNRRGENPSWLLKSARALKIKSSCDRRHAARTSK